MRHALVTLSLFIGCSSDTPIAVPVLVRDDVADAARAAYADHRADLDADRRALYARYRSAPNERTVVVRAARERLERAFREDLMPAWRGTRWAFSGVSATPGVGTIACGHFVATALDHLGFEVERIELGQQASEHIARTFVPKADLLRFSNRTADDVAFAVAQHGDGIYALGLDFHAAFLDVRGGQVDMCHASNLGRGVVVCEPAAAALGFASRYRVAGRLFDDAMVAGWLEGRAFPTYRPQR